MLAVPYHESLRCVDGNMSTLLDQAASFRFYEEYLVHSSNTYPRLIRSKTPYSAFNKLHWTWQLPEAPGIRNSLFHSYSQHHKCTSIFIFFLKKSKLIYVHFFRLYIQLPGQVSWTKIKIFSINYIRDLKPGMRFQNSIVYFKLCIF